MFKLPQVAQRTEHHFAHGMYVRTIFSPAGTVIVGKVHKTEHLYGILTGKIRLAVGDDVREIDASDGPKFMKAVPGTRRAVCVLEDSWRMNVMLNPTDETELEALESSLVEDEPTPFLPGNLLRELT